VSQPYQTIKVYYAELGGHTHTRWFSGPDHEHCGCNGGLVFTNEEWAHVKNALVRGHDTRYVNLVLKEEKK